MRKFLRFSLVALFAVLGMSNAMAEDVTDVLTSAAIGVTSYQDWSKSFTSNATYAGNTTANNGAIQMRSKNNSGIVTTASGGKIKSITIEWNDNTPNQPGGDNPQTRTLQIYGNNTAYTATSDLYGSSKGTLLGSSTYDGTAKVTINVDGDYTFIGIRSEANALYLDKITIVWESTAATKVDAELSFPEDAYTAYLNKAFTAPTLTNPNNVTVEYTSSNEEAATVDASTGAITLVAKGTTTITATVPDTDESYKGFASYTLSVETADITNTEETAYTVAKAIELIDAGDGLSAEVYVKGIISQIDKFNDDKSITYWISDDGTTNNQFECYHGKGIEGADFAATTDLKIGATVIAKGVMTKYNTTYEFGLGNVLVSYDESTAGEQVDISNEPETAYTVAKAYELIDAGKGLDAEVYVTGKISKIDKLNSDGSINYWISDDGSATNQFECFKGKGINGADFTAKTDLKLGATVIVKGKMKKYNTTYEFDAGNVLISYDESTAVDPEEAIEGGTTAETALTVDQALAYINDFPDGFTTTNQYYVTGTVSSDPEISTDNGYATFQMYGTTGILTIYHVKGLQNNSITKEGYVDNGDDVIILAKLQKFVKDNTTTPEMSSGYIYSLNGNTTEPETPVVFEGDGTQEDPYTVGDLKLMKESAYPTEEVWVKGVIIGSAKSKLALHEGTDEDANVASNIAIAAEATRASSLEFIPVKLDAGSIFRTELNVKDNPGNIGEEVLLKGKISSYFSATGVTDLSVAVFKGETLGIQNLTIDVDDNAPMYNLKGERVDANYRGVVIKAGKKTIQK